MMARVIAALLAVLTTVLGADAHCGFLLTAPKVLISGQEERMCITLNETAADTQFDVSLVKSEVVWQQTEHINGVTRCFMFRVPRGATAGRRTLRVSGRSVAEDCEFEGQSQIYVQPPKSLIYIQTDKPIYKPGQKVQLRILTLKTDLKPKDVMVSLVAVENPSGVRVMQWLNQTTTKGLLSLNMPLSEEPTLGVWKLKVEMLGVSKEQTFKVEEYVLPKFEVVVNMPTYVLVNAIEIEGEICAKYTYGKPVIGTANVSVCVDQKYYRNRNRPCVEKSTKLNGCVKFVVNASEMQLSSKRWSMWNAVISAAANVKESATGVILSGSSENTKVSQDPLVINLKDHSHNYFKPGLPFHGMGLVTKPDGTPAAGEQISVSEDSTTTSGIYTTDENGQFFYTLPPPVKNVIGFSIVARAVSYASKYDYHRHSLNQPTAYLRLKQWFSPSGSFLKVQLLQDTVQCGSTLQANVSYTTVPGTTFKFFYQVMSRGNIVWTSHKNHHFAHIPGHVNDPPRVDPPRSRQRRTSVPHPEIPLPGQEEDEPQIPPLGHVGYFPVSVPISPEMSPAPKLLVFYIRPDGETVADSVDFAIDKCFANNVSLHFSSDQLVPGQQMSLKLKADPGSLCALGVVDKSVHLLGGNNKLTMEKVFASLKEYDLGLNEGPVIESDYCDKYVEARDRLPWLDGRPGPPGPPAPEPFIPRPPRRFRVNRRARRSIFPGGQSLSKYVDSSRAFTASGMVVVTNQQVDTRPCYLSPMILYSMAVFERDGVLAAPEGAMASPAVRRLKSDRSQTENNVDEKKSQETVVDLRTYFPETWLWQLVDMGNNGRQVIREELPHTITEWVGSAFCSNTQTGLGVSGMATIKAFQPFFASFTLPYSVIRKEKVPVLVTVFNYLSECLVVELALKNEPGFKIIGGSRRTKVCVCGSQSVSHTYYIVAQTIGQVNVTVKATSVLDEEVCGNGLTLSTQTGARDAVTRTLLVEPEGREEEHSVAGFICPANGKPSNESFELPLPENIIADSARGYVTVIGDVMGSSLSGLDKLLRMPTGCGEQNMLNFAPNTYVHQYLTDSDQLTSSVEEKSLGFMRHGYQREQNYRHDDGSYSAFGMSDTEGSMWLTAFVVKSFARARPYISIDEEKLMESLQWFKSRQLENGCFPMVGRVLHKDMKGGLENSRAPAALTAYVLISMLEAGVDKQDQGVTAALQCLRSQDTSDVYTAALVAYAYTLYDPQGQARSNAMSTLRAMAVTSGGMMHWRVPKVGKHTTNPTALYDKPTAVDVETTAYALLAYVTSGSDDSTSNGVAIVKWLTKQRNAHGGFASTQDTVVALQALAKFASLFYRDGISMKVLVDGNNFNKSFSINGHNKLVLQTEKIDVPNNVTVTLSGQGCAVFQANIKYNLPVKRDRDPAFTLRINVPNRGVASAAVPCKRRSMTVCTRYRGPGDASNMAIVAVKMVSGWIPNKDSIDKLKQDTKLGIKRIDTDHKWVNFYFDELTAQSKCFTFMIDQDIEVKNTKPAYAEVYDYYDKDLIVQEKYHLKRVCGTKNELPVLTREEFEKAEASGIVEQRRVPIEPLLPQLAGVQRGPTPCPSCLGTIPENFGAMFCAVSHAYRTEATRTPLRLIVDLRPRSKVHVMKSVTVSLPTGCACSALSPESSGKLVILTEAEIESDADDGHSLRLDANSTVLQVPGSRSSFRKLVKKALRRRDCRR